ncbi:MAG: BBP7 family outer membrane beta-barrel protein [Planctomycetia bacterium]
METLMVLGSWKWVRRCWFLPALALIVMGASCCEPVAATEESHPILMPPPDPSIDVTSVAFQTPIPVAEPLWTDYALTEALFWQRDNQAGSIPLIVDRDSGATLISAGDPQFPVAAGVRSFYGRRTPCQGGWEIGYFGVYGMSASSFAAVTPPAYLQMPNPIGSALTDRGESATVKYNSLINSAEANVFSTRHEWRESSQSWLTVDWLAGFRYVNVEEQSSIVVNCCVDDSSLKAVRYSLRTHNNMFGGQVGTRGRWTWNQWAIEGWAKAGLLGNAESQVQDPLIDFTPYQQRGVRSGSGSEVGFIGDLNLSVIYRLSEVWGIRAGYNTVWINGLALAPRQFDFAVSDLAGTGLNGGGGMFLSGANLGLEARW